MSPTKLFPEPRLLKINKDGYIQFTAKQWSFLVKMTKTKAKTVKGKMKAVSKFVHLAIGNRLKRSNETDSNR